jgi:hypothetical protein
VKLAIPSSFLYQVLLPPKDVMGGEQHYPHVDTTALEAALETLRQGLERRSEESRRLQEVLVRGQP